MNHLAGPRLAMWKPLPVRPRSYLGQAQSVRVTVIDIGGRPVGGAVVTVSGVSKTTDTSGDAVIEAGPGSKEIVVEYDGRRISEIASSEDIARGNNVFVKFPFCIRDPLVKPIDLAILAGAAALTAAGYYWKVDPLKVAGELVFGAEVFGLIYRMSCL